MTPAEMASEALYQDRLARYLRRPWHPAVAVILAHQDTRGRSGQFHREPT